jgi:hypothetical protein
MGMESEDLNSGIGLHRQCDPTREATLELRKAPSYVSSVAHTATETTLRVAWHGGAPLSQATLARSHSSTHTHLAPALRQIAVWC